MKWTRDFPAVEGWYFWRRNSRSGDSLHWAAVFYESAADSFFEANIKVGPPHGGEWAGPIPEPEE